MTSARFNDILDEIDREAIRSIEKHGEQRHLPMGTGRDTFPLETKITFDGDHLSPWMRAETLADLATLDTKAHSFNEGGDGTVTWWQILREEVFEVAAEADPALLRAELVQVAAVALKMIDALDRPSVAAEETSAISEGEWEYGFYDSQDVTLGMTPRIWWYCFGLHFSTAEQADHTGRKSTLGHPVIVRRQAQDGPWELVPEHPDGSTP